MFEDSYDTQSWAAIAGNFQNSRFVVGTTTGMCDTNGAYITTGSRFGSY